jgi:L(+)-tartrate dehydratase beta subunit
MGRERTKLPTVRLKTPFVNEQLSGLEIGTVVYLDGVVFTGREGVYKRVIDDGVALPKGVSELSNVNFHCSPAASVNTDGSYKIGGVTATASFRFSRWLPEWFSRTGCQAIIGKGGMSEADYREIFVPAGAVYLTTVGYGTGALLGRGIKRIIDVHWLEDLGIAQAMWVLEVESFGPLLVESDLQGRSLFESNNAAINKNIEDLYAGLKKPALARFGETADKTDELI